MNIWLWCWIGAIRSIEVSMSWRARILCEVLQIFIASVGKLNYLLHNNREKWNDRWIPMILQRLSKDASAHILGLKKITMIWNRRWKENYHAQIQVHPNCKSHLRVLDNGLKDWILSPHTSLWVEVRLGLPVNQVQIHAAKCSKAQIFCETSKLNGVICLMLKLFSLVQIAPTSIGKIFTLTVNFWSSFAHFNYINLGNDNDWFIEWTLETILNRRTVPFQSSHIHNLVRTVIIFMTVEYVEHGHNWTLAKCVLRFYFSIAC